MAHIIAPSVLSADFLNLGRDVDMLCRSHAQWLHLDVMDGVFVPNISFGFPAIAALTAQANAAGKTVDAHLMIVEPQKFITRFRDFGVGLLTVHLEACTHLHRTLSEIRSAGMKAGVAINPHTPVEALTDILEDADLALIMSVNPGFGGQKYIARSTDKIRRLRAMIDSRQLKTLIEVDGGIDLTNCNEVANAGADAIVAGNAIFGSDNPEAMIKRFTDWNDN
jgi:ribulose-phosphate 3-epimerase